MSGGLAAKSVSVSLTERSVQTQLRVGEREVFRGFRFSWSSLRDRIHCGIPHSGVFADELDPRSSGPYPSVDR